MEKRTSGRGGRNARTGVKGGRGGSVRGAGDGSGGGGGGSEGWRQMDLLSSFKAGAQRSTPGASRQELPYRSIFQLFLMVAVQPLNSVNALGC